MPVISKIQIKNASVTRENLLKLLESVRNVPESFTEQGQEIIEIKNIDDHFSVKMRRIK